MPIRFIRRLLRKVIIVGDRKVGKTQVFRSFVEDGQRRVNKESHARTFRVADTNGREIIVEVRLFDMLTSDPYSVTPGYYRSADAVLLVFDENNINSMNNLLNIWIPQIKAKSDNPDPVMFLVKVSAEPNDDPSMPRRGRAATEHINQSQFTSFGKTLKDHVKLEEIFEIAPGVFTKSSIDEMFQKIVPVLIRTDDSVHLSSDLDSVKVSQENSSRGLLDYCYNCFHM